MMSGILDSADVLGAAPRHWGTPGCDDDVLPVSLLQFRYRNLAGANYQNISGNAVIAQRGPERNQSSHKRGLIREGEAFESAERPPKGVGGLVFSTSSQPEIFVSHITESPT